ncbi:MAG: hypothetical protein ACJ75B_13010 [Flavisolibacter sp.]
MKRSLSFVGINIFLLIASCVPCYSQFSWDDIKKTVGSVVNTGVNVVTAPTQTIINAGQSILGNQSSGSILQPWKDIGSNAGNAIIGGTRLASAPNDFMYQKARDFAQQAGGDAGSFIFDLGTFTSQFYNQLGVAGANNLGAILKGQNPLVISAAPLAAAIHAARESHYQNSKPIPDAIKQSLSGIFSQQVLSRARYAVGKVEITLPNFIGKGVKYNDDHYAVTVDDIIVFKVEPGITGFLSWWAHEIRHTEQYMQWGVELFAYKYIKDLGTSIEGDAESYEKRVTGTSLTEFHTQARFADNWQSVEKYVAQCFFPQDPYPVNYMVTDQGKIIAVNTMDGSWMQVGWSAPPVFEGTSWSYQTPMFRYSVTPQGGIFLDRLIYDQFGRLVSNQPLQVGHVVTLQ